MTQDLIEKAIKGDLESFEIIVRKYKNSVYNLVLRILNDREEAQDVTQEAFIKLYSSLPSFRGEAKFANWLYRIATNVCIDRYRLERREINCPQQKPSSSFYLNGQPY